MGAWGTTRRGAVSGAVSSNVSVQPQEVDYLPLPGEAVVPSYETLPFVVRLSTDGKDYTKIAVDGWKELPDA